jgi:hypothetical protein
MELGSIIILLCVLLILVIIIICAICLHFNYRKKNYVINEQLSRVVPPLSSSSPLIIESNEFINNNKTNLQPQESEENDSVKQIIDLLHKSKIKLIAFDFDCTILSIHTFGQWTDSPEELAEYVRPYFKQLIIGLLKSSYNFNICLVSYSPQEELIRKVLEISLKLKPTEIINKIIVKGNTKEFVEKNGYSSCSNGKELHLKYCCDLLANKNIKNKNIFLFDDDFKNVKLAINSGHSAFQVTNTVQLIDILNFLKKNYKSEEV